MKQSELTDEQRRRRVGPIMVRRRKTIEENEHFLRLYCVLWILAERGKPYNSIIHVHLCSITLLQKYTSSNKLVIQGGSAGGLLICAVMNMRPELYRVSDGDKLMRSLNLTNVHLLGRIGARTIRRRDQHNVGPVTATDSQRVRGVGWVFDRHWHS